MNEIYAVRVPNTIQTSDYKSLMSSISKYKQQRISKIKHTRNKYQSLIGDILIRNIIIRKNIRQTNNEIEIVQDTYSKPYLKGDVSFNFNISHSKDWVVCAISSSIVGIDIEFMDKNLDVNIFNNHLSEDEFYSLKEKGFKSEEFYKLWTLKESYVKAVGKGLYIPFQSFSIIEGFNQIKVQSESKEESFYFKNYSSIEGYTISVCSKTNSNPNNITYFSFQELLNFTNFNKGNSFII
jgi:4'-phosphopantetheinyl transferase